METTPTTSTFRKPNSALVMMPKVGKLTAITRKIFNVMLQVTQRQVAALATGGQGVQATHRFRARLSDLVGPIESGESNLITYVKNSLREMRRVELDWEAPDANSEVIWSNMSLLSEVRITREKADNVLYAEWALPPGLMEVIADPARFTPIDIVQLAQLRTYAAVALYEICSRYRNNPSGVTSEQNMDWWIGALSQSALPIDPQTKLPKPRNWSKFKDDQLKAAMDEINRKSDLSVELIEKKTGRKLTSAQFRVSRKPASTSASPRPSKMAVETAQTATRLGLALPDIAGLIKQGHSESVILLALAKLEARLARDDLAAIDSRMAYLRTVLAELGTYVAEAPAAPLAAPAPTSPNAELPQALTYKEQRRAAIKEELLNLGKDQQRRYAERALEMLQQIGMASTTISRKVASSDWSSGLLLSKMVEAYALENYGPSWSVDPQQELA